MAINRKIEVGLIQTEPEEVGIIETYFGGEAESLLDEKGVDFVTFPQSYLTSEEIKQIREAMGHGSQPLSPCLIFYEADEDIKEGANKTIDHLKKQGFIVKNADFEKLPKRVQDELILEMDTVEEEESETTEGDILEAQYEAYREKQLLGDD